MRNILFKLFCIAIVVFVSFIVYFFLINFPKANKSSEIVQQWYGKEIILPQNIKLWDEIPCVRIYGIHHIKY